MKLVACIASALILFIGCDDATDIDDGKRLIVEGYLYEGRPVRGIKISELVPLISDEQESYRVENAHVIIRASDGREYELSDDQTEPGSYFSDELIIARGLIYELEVQFDNQRVFATTSVPSSPTGLEISSDTIEIAQINEFTDIINQRDREDISIGWENDEGNPYFVKVENRQGTELIFNLSLPDGFENAFEFITEPTTSDSYFLRGTVLERYGTHDVILFSLNQEYADLYNTSGEDSRSFSEPLTNIENGLGIFTAFSSDTVQFTIIKP